MATAPYVINPDDPTQPTENLTMGAAAAELRGLKQRVLLAREETADLETRALAHEGANPYELDAQFNANENKITELPQATEASDAVPLSQVLALIGAAGSGIVASVRQKWIATEGQTVFLLTLFSYVPTANNIAVYVDGIRQDSGTAYLETNSTSFTFTEGLQAGSVVHAFSNESVNADAVAVLRSDLASTASGKGATLVRLESGETVQQYVEQLPKFTSGRLLPVTTQPVLFFGDSITAGVGASNPSLCYRSLVSAAFASGGTNNAISGGSIMDWADTAMAQSVESDRLSVILPGYNDQRFIGDAAPSQQAYRLGLYALAAHLAIPAARKTLGNSASITKTGTWSATPVYSDGIFSTQIGATATVKAVGSAVYICTIQQLLEGGRFSVTVDGESYGSFTCNQAVANGGAVSSINYLPMLVRIGGLPDGEHVVTITVETKDAASASNSVYVQWVAGSSAGAGHGGRVYLGNTLRMTAVGATKDGPNYDNYTAAGNAALSDAAAEVAGVLRSDGLPVFGVPVSGAFDPAADMGPDNVHPDDAGHAKLAALFLSGMNAVNAMTDQREISRLRALVSQPQAQVISWTPALAGSIVAGAHTYGARSGVYSIRGGLCFCTFDVVINTVDASMGGYAFIGLPVANSAGEIVIGSVGVRDGVALVAGSSGVYGELFPTGTRLVLRQDTNPQTNVDSTHLSAGLHIRGTIVYPV